ncbi:MAG: DUF4177 domain-containing protein [Thermomicrobiales bacterium]|jgi:hypothetical protein|nr:DUF4177 domain-containing protein [Thermomicrobiales bacterium]
MQRWEYRVFHRQRTVTLGEVSSGWDENVVAMLPELGAAGWELVTVLPRSSTGGAVNAGMTTDELWIFKRPQQAVPADAKLAGQAPSDT